MKISVLIAAFRAGRYLAPALASIEAQTHRNWELIVVEDGSRDETESLVQAFAARVAQPVRYENLERNHGVAAARNRLLELAQGDAVAFIDADDAWTADHLALANDQLEKGADLVVSGVDGIDLATGRLLFTYHPDPALLQDPIGTLFRNSAIITSSSVTLRRSTAHATGWFDPSLRIGEDRDYWLRAALAGARFAAAPRATCHYAKHSESTMARTLLVAEQTVRFYRKYRGLAAVPPSERRRRFAQSLVVHARLARRADPRASLRSIVRAWFLAPLDFNIASQVAYTGLAVARHNLGR